MPFTVNLSGTAEVDDSIVELYDQAFIIAQEQEQVMDQFVTYKRDIGAKSISMPKYAQLALATTPLVETDDVTSEAMADTPIVFTPAEHGNVVTRTMLASLQTGGKIDLAAARLVGLNGQRTYDKLAILALDASANLLTPGGTAVGSLLATDVMSPTVLNLGYNKLARQSVAPLPEGMFAAVMHDDVIHDLRNGAGAGSWVDINKYARPETVLRNEVGMLNGFRIVRDNHSTIEVDAGNAGTVDVYSTYLIAANGLGKAESMPMEMRITGPFDKLARFVNMGWYGVVKYGIVDTQAVYKIKTASSVGVNV